jgi:hypothetical protein
MESPVRTSFIPKQAVQVPMTRRNQPVISIFTVIGIFVFISAIAASGGVFLYHTYLIQKITEQEKLLESKKGEFKLEQINEWTLLDKKIKSAKKILNNHVAPSRVFYHLEENTLANVRFTKFELSKDQDSDAEAGSMKLLLEGDAPRISTIVVQSEQFGSKRDIFVKPFFHNLKLLDESRRYAFSVETYIPSAELQYLKKFDLTEPAAVEPGVEPVGELLPEDTGDLSEEVLLDDTQL